MSRSGHSSNVRRAHRARTAAASVPDAEALGRLFRRLLRVTGVSGAVVVGGCMDATLQDSSDAGTGGMRMGGTGATGSGGLGGTGAAGAGGTGSGGDGGGGMGTGGDDHPGALPPECSAQGNPKLAHGLQLAMDVDYLGIHSFTDLGGGAPFVLDSIGAACMVPDVERPACLAELDSSAGLSFDACFDYCTATAVVTTEAGVVTKRQTTEALLALLGPIDTPSEALLLARLHGYAIKCDGDTTVREVMGGYEVVVDNTASCDGNYYRWTLLIRPDGQLTVVDQVDLGPANVVCGRRPGGLVSDGHTPASSPTAAYFAACVHLESAAVQAFEMLALELLHHGAPGALVEAARRSADEERTHTRLAAELAAAAKAPTPAPVVDDVVLRDLFAIARENVVEGCVRETYGAMLAHFQATHAGRADIADAMRTIAPDETRHAALSWALHAWIAPRLSAAERAELIALRTAAVDALRDEMTRPLPAGLTAEAGLPAPAQAAAIIDGLAVQLWAGAA